MARPTALSRRQRAVFDLLCQADRPLGAYALLDRLRNDGFNSPMQVYRVLHGLVEKGAVHRLKTLNAYVPCGQPGGREHGPAVLAVCLACGRLREFADREVTSRLAAWSERSGFRLTGAMIEVQGVCLSCEQGSSRRRAAHDPA